MIPRDRRSSSFLLLRNLSNHTYRQARTGDTVLVRSREITGRSQTLQWGDWVRRGKDVRKKIIGPVDTNATCIYQQQLEVNVARRLAAEQLRL